MDSFELGDSDSVQIGDYIGIIGFPAIGGSTVTYTKGNMSGFFGPFIKTDAEINKGNSGGAAIDNKGKLIGITSASSGLHKRKEGEGKLGLVRPINIAQPMIDIAYSGC